MSDMGLAEMYGREAGTPTFDVNQNMNDAQKLLGMTPEERAMYQRHLTNLWGSGGVDNADGSRSTLYQANVTGPGGQATNIPTVYDGRILPVPEAVQRAAQQGWGKFPSYPTPEAAESRYVDQMHPTMDKDTGAYFDVRRASLLPPGVAALYER